MKLAAGWRRMMLLALILIVLSCLCWTLSVSAAPLVKVEVSNTTAYESLTVLNPRDGNWIEVVGGKDVRLPSVTLIYNGINSADYTKEDKKIKITTYGINEYEDYIVDYPFSELPVYYNDDAVTVKVLGEGGIAGEKAHIYMMKTYPTEIRDALSSAVDANTKPLRDLLNNSIHKPITLDSAGDCTAPFGTLNPGDYVVVATLNVSSALDITLISTATFQVLEHESTLEVSDVTRTSVSESAFVSGEFTIISGNATYSYIVALIKKDEKIDLLLESRGTKAETNLMLNDAVLVESFKIGAVGLENVDAAIIYDLVRNAFTTASVEKGKGGNTYDFSLPVIEMPDGDYYLYAAAWNSTNSSQHVVAFSQKSVKITTILPSRGGASTLRDSDGDGYSDIEEMLAGTDPKDPCDPNPECVVCLAIKPPTPSPSPTPAPKPTVTPTIPPLIIPTPSPSPSPYPIPIPTPPHASVPGIPMPLALIIIGIIVIADMIIGFLSFRYYRQKAELKRKE